ncbi:MAG: hypothetical protein AABZ84_06655 [Pseudomonadota bacterium]
MESVNASDEIYGNVQVTGLSINGSAINYAYDNDGLLTPTALDNLSTAQSYNGFNAGMQNGSSALPINLYGSFASPKGPFTNRGTGISASAAAGAEFKAADAKNAKIFR